MESENKSKGGQGLLTGFLLGLVTGLLIVSAIFAGKSIYGYVKAYTLDGAVKEESGTQAESSSGIINSGMLKKLSVLEQIINENYYKTDVAVEQLETGIYKGMIAALGDPYAEYYSAEELKIAKNSMEGITFGIGAYIGYDQEQELVSIGGIMEDGSAAESDLREGDFIVKVDGIDVRGYTSSQVVALVRGPENTTVHLTIYREGEMDYLEFDLVRKKSLEANTVYSGVMEGDIGYLRIMEFDDVTPDQYTEAMAVLNENKIKGLILDLRSNPGGSLAAVTEIARKILPKGLIVYTEDRDGKRNEHTCNGENELQMPLVVLINGNSASASEILAGAIQDYKKGILIGNTTYGKGVVQQVISLSDGTAVKLTVSSYFTPLGKNLGGVGVTPDIEVEFDKDAYFDEGIDVQIDRAIEVITEQIGD